MGLPSGYRGFKKRKDTMFQKGHVQKNVIADKKAKIPSRKPSIMRNMKRPEQHIYDLGVRDSDMPMSVLRPKASSCDTEVESSKTKDSDFITSNRIISMDELGTFMSQVALEHGRQDPPCQIPCLRFPKCHEIVQGLGSSVRVTCTNCNYMSACVRLYKVVKGKVGRPNAVLNKRLGQWYENTSTSHDDTRLLFAMLDCQSPAEKTLSRNAQMADKVHVKKGEETLENNKKVVSEVLDHVGGHSITGSDTCYNNVPKGRHMSQPGTQTSTPFFDFTTKKPILIGMETRSQHCPQRRPGEMECRGDHPGCTQSAQPWIPMSRVEQECTKVFYDDLKDTVLEGKVKKHIADGCKTLMLDVNDADMEKLLCVRHVSRNQRTHFYKKNFSDTLLGQGTSVQYRKTVLINSIMDRCSSELTKARHKFPRDDEKFYEMAEKARTNIVSCLEGNHAKCRQSSLVCRGSSSILKNGQRLYQMEDSDKRQIQEVIDVKLGPEVVVKQRYLLSTNVIEAMHLRTVKLCPKSKLYTGTHRGRHLNAVMLESLGLTKSVLVVGKEFGYTFGPEAVKTLEQIRNRRRYHKERQQTNQFKRRRHSLIYKKLRVKNLHKLGVETARSVPRDHKY